MPEPAQLWSEVDNYLNATLVPPDPVLEVPSPPTPPPAFPPSTSAPPRANSFICSPQFKAQSAFSKSAPSAATAPSGWPAPCPPDGHLITFEFEPKARRRRPAKHRPRRPRAPRRNPHRPSRRLARAAPRRRQPEPFDLIFIDADKPNNPTYLEWALKFSRKGTLIVVDNVIRDGEIANATSTDPSITGTRAMFDMLAANSAPARNRPPDRRQQRLRRLRLALVISD